jgi:hypothetical protein
MRTRFAVVAVALSLVSVSREVTADDADHATFRLSVASITETGQPSTARLTLAGASGRVPVVSPGWTCGWTRTWARGDEALVVECFPRDDSQGVSSAVFCSDIVPGQQSSSMMVTTVDAGVSRKTRFDLFCQTR